MTMFNKATIHITDCLSLELLNTTHFDALFEVSKDKRSIEDFQKATGNREYFMGWIHEAMSENERAWVIKYEGRVCGLVSFENITGPVCEIGFFLDHHLQGMNIGTSAISAAISQMCQLNPKIRKIVAFATDGNIASRRVLEKCGFRVVQILKKNWSWGGNIHDSIELQWLTKTSSSSSVWAQSPLQDTGGV